ncbi:MAG: hypothetical protein H7Y07_10135 [Pyrinomonadaceae bacterium]|nr:hypothetical protein [Sphingobacteriaceae bacterium]
MKNTEHLQALGQETLYIESIYLDLKIEEALAGNDFGKSDLLLEAEKLWKDINAEYYNFLNFLQNNNLVAA